VADLMTERRPQMFPRLSDPQIARVATFGERRHVARGQVLFEVGDTNRCFFVIVSGALAVERPFGQTEETITVHRAGEFTGELDMLSGRRSLVRGQVVEDGEVIAMPRERLREIVQVDADLSEIFMRAFILRRMGLFSQHAGDVAVIGSRHSAGTLRLREFLSRNAHPHAYVDVDTDPGVQQLLDQFHVTVCEVPVVICLRGKSVLRNPSNEALAHCLGWTPALNPELVHDLVVVGAGPGGLAASVYAASEGLDVMALETSAPGGQAGTSSKIENYLGFPTGISGGALAGRAYVQAEKFGAVVAVARTAVELECGVRPYTIVLDDGARVRARTVVIASGARYRKLPLANLGQYEGVGVYYGATYVESQVCGAEEVIVVGGGNSAGQAAVYLSQSAAHVHLLVRGDGLSNSMSRYLINRIEDSPNITLRTHTSVDALEGESHLERVRWRRGPEVETRDIRHLFLMIGAQPNTAWLHGCVALDNKGFVKTGAALSPEELAGWPLPRAPQLLETSLPGVFAVGDVRSQSVKRVASAVGEGSICIQLVHAALQE
jgi:thioredoxin reductase (NADPH)